MPSPRSDRLSGEREDVRNRDDRSYETVPDYQITVLPKGTQLSEKTKQATLKSFAMLHITGAGNMASFPFGHVPTRGTTDEQQPKSQQTSHPTLTTDEKKATEAESHKKKNQPPKQSKT